MTANIGAEITKQRQAVIDAARRLAAVVRRAKMLPEERAVVREVDALERLELEARLNASKWPAATEDSSGAQVGQGAEAAGREA